ncbi:MAG TPA: hypothetical protein VHC20_05610 [Candidatus Paceibacterota bacterium]|nr:hypothetical protein [Candidatus Paceibacterota bacterium]
MKTSYKINRDDLRPPGRDQELALFTCALQSAALRDWLAGQRIEAPAQFELTHNTGADDPPDLSALGLGWECTEFPPNQTATRKVHRENGPMGMVVPGFSQTGADIRKIREQSIPFTAYPKFVALDDEIAALGGAFLGKVIGGPKSKDVPGNDVLLLDQRDDHAPDLAEKALRLALRKTTPKHIRLVLLVRFQRHTTELIPEVVRLFP